MNKKELSYNSRLFFFYFYYNKKDPIFYETFFAPLPRNTILHYFLYNVNYSKNFSFSQLYVSL